jgi:hypothetical protein
MFITYYIFSTKYITKLSIISRKYKTVTFTTKNLIIKRYSNISLYLSYYCESI